jgi:hypothetical protein
VYAFDSLLTKARDVFSMCLIVLEWVGRGRRDASGMHTQANLLYAAYIE